MNWEAIAAAGQLLGSVAVLATLGYLAIQIRQVRSQMARTASQARWDSLRDLMLARVQNPEFARIYYKVWDAFASTAGAPTPTPFATRAAELGIGPEEWRQFNAYSWAMWFYREQGIMFVSDLTPGQRVQFDHALRSSLSSASPDRAWFEANRPILNPEAVQYIDALLAQPTNVDSDPAAR